MLTALSIRDVVLIERLELGFGPGLTVLTGETGAGKSILLDSLGLALGGRAEAGLVRPGAEQASVAACFARPPGHPAQALLAEQGIAGRRRDRAAPGGRRATGARAASSTTSRSASRCCAAPARCWSRCRASTSRWAWPTPPAMPACWTRSACRRRCAQAVGAAMAGLARGRGGAGGGARRPSPTAAARRGLAAPRGR